jgi:hypothetical protein
MVPLSRQTDRRKLNVRMAADKRAKGGRERRRCPTCGVVLDQSVRTLAGGTVTASTCASCGWTKSSRQKDAHILALKMVLSLGLEAHDGGLAAVIPPELAAALKAKAGDEWILSPLITPIGSLPMKWTLSLKKNRS